MKLTLADSDGLVIDQWEINQDIDLPDLDELTDCLYAAGFYNDEQKALMGDKK
jgi:hypothetical protein